MRIRSTLAGLCIALPAAVVGGGCESTAPTPAVSLISRLMTSELAACAIDATGAVFCWGANTNFFEFGAPPSAIASSPIPVAVPVPRLAGFARGVGTHLCGIDFEGVGICWGRGTFGQLGAGTAGDVGNAWTYVSNPKSWDQIAVGRLTTCGVTADAAGYCWGANQAGEVGDAAAPIATNVLLPREVMGERQWKSIVTGWIHACGITMDNETLCWGGNTSGQLGIGVADTVAQRVPLPVDGGHDFVQLSLGARHSCGVTRGGAAYCWGQNSHGEVGDGTTALRSAPTRVAGANRYSFIATSSGFAGGSNVFPPTGAPQGAIGHTCALTVAGAAFCWGWNGNGQLGNADINISLVPVAVLGGHTFTTIALGGSYTCAWDNGVWCWGANAAGQLGIGTTAPSTIPRPVGSPFSP